MQFTMDFLRVFGWGVYLAAPIVLFFLAVIITMGQIVGRREGWSRFDAVYYAMITATTVGYGDFRPQTQLSKCLAILIAFCGLMFSGILVALAVQSAQIAFEKNHDIEELRSRHGTLTRLTATTPDVQP